jgi:biotin operon repressor
MTTRFDIERALLASDLPSKSRHICHVLCIHVDARSNMILPQHQPSLTVLATETGISRRSIMRHLNVLERRGWIVRKVPTKHDQRTKHARTYYQVGIPQARDTLPLDDRIARDTEALGLGSPDPEARVTVAHRSSESSRSSDADLNTIIETIEASEGIRVDEAWAARVLEQIAGARDIRHRGAYARRVILAAPTGTYSPHTAPPTWTTKDGKGGFA